MDRILPRNSRKRLVNIDDIGGKGFGLYRLAKLSRRLGYKVPDFFIIPTNYVGPEGNITLRARYLDGEGNYAVRSSSPFEDSKKHSFAGIFKTHLDVPRSDLIDAIRDVRNSASSEKAKRYAQERGLNLDDKMAVIVQRMVEPDAGGVIYSTLPSYPIAASVEFCEGRGTGVVDGTESVEIHDYDKRTLEEIFESEDGVPTRTNAWHFDHVWNGKGLRESVEISQQLEKEFGYPLDIEFAWTYRRNRGNLHLLQARAITDIEPYREIEIPSVSKQNVLLQAEVVRGIGEFEGPAAIHTYVIHGMLEPFERLKRELREIDSAFPDGYALFVPDLFSYADYDECTPNKKAIIEFSNSHRSSHAMTVAREKGVLYMGKGNLGFNPTSYEEDITSRIKNGDIVKVVLSGREGLAFKVEEGTNPLPVNFYD